MPTNLIEYELDPTGLEVSNLITNEVHNNVDTLTGIVIPKFGDFFTDGLVIRNNTNAILVRDVDYVPIEFNQEASLKYGKEICRGILVLTNKALSPFTITYQVLGGQRSYSNENLLAVLQDKILPPQPIEYAEIYDVPVQFPPEHHLHDIDEVYGFEKIVAALNRVKVAIEVGSFPAFKSLMGFLDSSLLKIRIDMNAYLDDRMEEELQKFKDQFTKEYFGIENIPNLRRATEAEGYAVGAKSFLSTGIVENKLMTLEALVGLKKVFFESFIRKQMTGLDLSSAVYGAPTAVTIRDMSNRSTITVISKNSALLNEVPYDESVYPLELPDANEFIILKVSNGLSNGGGDIIGFDQIGKVIYHGNVAQGWSGVEISWKQNFAYDQLQALKATIQTHIEDEENPHETDKTQIGLDKVENLPVVTKQELDDITSVRKYMTFDSLMYFMRTHMLQNGPTSIVPENSQNKFLIDNAVVVFAPGGGCSLDPKPVITGLNGTAPTNMTIGWSINGGKPNSKFIMTSGLIGREPTVKEFRLNANGSYVGYTNTGRYPGTIQSLFSFEGGESIMANTIVEMNDCAVEAPVLVKLSQACATVAAEPTPDPYDVEYENKQLLGVYGYTTTPAAGPNFTQLMQGYSYCCGTREPVPVVAISTTHMRDKVQWVSLTGGIPNCLVEGRVIYNDGLGNPDIYLNFNTRLDSTGYANIPVLVPLGQIAVEMLLINEQKTLVEATLYAYEPLVGERDTIIYLHLSNPAPEHQQPFTVKVTTQGLNIGESYNFRFYNPLTNENYQFINSPPLFTALNETEVFSFDVPYTEINTDEFQIVVELV